MTEKAFRQSNEQHKQGNDNILLNHSYFQLVTWSIDQHREKELEEELKRVGVAFRMWEERSTDGSGGGVKKWTAPDGELFSDLA